MEKTSFFKSLPLMNQSTLNVDIENGIIKNICIVEEGLNKNKTYFNNQFLHDLVEQGNEQKQGVKSRFGHPNMCSTSLGTFLGRYKNFRVEENKVFADLHLDESAKKTPNGDLYTYTLDMAENNADMCGNSIHIKSDMFDEQVGKKVYPSHILESFVASDIVDSPAATNGLFNDTNDLGIIVTEFLDDNPSVFDAVAKDPDIIFDFLGRYSSYLFNNNKEKRMDFLKNLKKKIGLQETFDIEETTATGEVVTVKTDDETPKVGDPVTDADGKAVADGDLTIKDGTVWVIEGGKISEIKEAEGNDGDGDEEEPTLSEVMQGVNDLAETLNSFKTQFEDGLKENQDAIELVHDTFETKFNNLAKTVKSQKPKDYKGDPNKGGNKFASGYDPEKVKEAREARKNNEKE